jgi:hypothetical protein
VGVNNPLRQVIVNTHSPTVVSLVPEDSLVMVKTEPHSGNGMSRVPVASFRWLSGTWRDELIRQHALSKGELLAYLNPAAVSLSDLKELKRSQAGRRRVIDRPDLRQMVFFSSSSPSS